MRSGAHSPQTHSSGDTHLRMASLSVTSTFLKKAPMVMGQGGRMSLPGSSEAEPWWEPLSEASDASLDGNLCRVITRGGGVDHLYGPHRGGHRELLQGVCGKPHHTFSFLTLCHG